MKYIDADKLIGKIEKSKNELKSLMSKLYYAANYKEWEAELNGYNKILSIITSLQQEQPEQKIDFEVKFAEFLERKDSELGAESWSEDDLRELALYFYYGRNDNVQPEVDLEKEIDDYIASNFSEAADGILLSDANRTELQITDVSQIARHFYELGLNARKK